MTSTAAADITLAPGNVASTAASRLRKRKAIDVADVAAQHNPTKADR